MVRANDIHRVREDLFVWQAYEPAVKCDLSSTAVRSDDGLLLIDPISLTDEALDELLQYGVPRVIACTSANHGRAAEIYRKQFDAPIAAHRESAPELGFTPDVWLEAGTILQGGVEVCEVRGAAAGEIALLLPGRFFCLGDAVVNLPQTGLSVLPDKYCTNPKVLRQSLQNLLRYEFSTLTFAHGLPLVAQARSRFEALLA